MINKNVAESFLNDKILGNGVQALAYEAEPSGMVLANQALIVSFFSTTAQRPKETKELTEGEAFALLGLWAVALRKCAQLRLNPTKL